MRRIQGSDPDGQTRRWLQRAGLADPWGPGADAMSQGQRRGRARTDDLCWGWVPASPDAAALWDNGGFGESMAHPDPAGVWDREPGASGCCIAQNTGVFTQKTSEMGCLISSWRIWIIPQSSAQ